MKVQLKVSTQVISAVMVLASLGEAGSVFAAGFVPKLECVTGNAQLVVESLAGDEAKVTLINPEGWSGEWKAKAVSNESDFFESSLTYALPGVTEPLQVVKQERQGRAGPIGFRYSAHIGALSFLSCHAAALSHVAQD
jgi:hypothetical protein